jgi:hypothetical protein
MLLASKERIDAWWFSLKHEVYSAASSAAGSEFCSTRGLRNLCFRLRAQMYMPVADSPATQSSSSEMRMRPAIELRDSLALARAKLWPVATASTIEPSKLFVEHIKLNRKGGLGASLAKVALSIPDVPGLLKKGLDKDYKENLY